MIIQEILKQAEEKMQAFDPESVVDSFIVDGPLPLSVAMNDVRNKQEVGNYCWFPGFIEITKPKQIVELGSAMGVAMNCMLASKHKDFELYGVTLAEHGLEFCYVKKNIYPNVHMITGDYMDLSVWPKDVDLGKTDLWYIDGLHEGQHVRDQLLLYKPFMKPGAIVTFDDVFINPGMAAMWHDVENILDVGFKTTLPLHWTGWGFLQIGDSHA